jgi:sugar/nucleoside kinase (ribokinase family)
MFTNSILGIGAQGWLRELDEEARVQRRAWTGAPFWTGGDVLFVSEEDLAGDERQLDRWLEEISTVVVTRERKGARVHSDGKWVEIEAFPADEVDPTGAGDVFAAAYLIRYEETEDVATAATFGSAAAAASVEAPGTEGIADRADIERRLAAHPEIVLT